MTDVYNKYSQLEVQQLLEMYYGSDVMFDVSTKNSRTGSNSLRTKMENFLNELDKAGLEIIEKERDGCKCGRSH